MRTTSILPLLAAMSLLQGCATTQPPLYQWGPYEHQIHAHFKGEAPEAQIALLEKHKAETDAKGLALPPGYVAHLGLLYSKVGRDADFVAALEEEKRRFPESSAYIDKLLSSAQKGGNHAKR